MLCGFLSAGSETERSSPVTINCSIVCAVYRLQKQTTNLCILPDDPTLTQKQRDKLMKDSNDLRWRDGEGNACACATHIEKRIFTVLLIDVGQYPKGLGSTVSELDISNAVCTVPKTKFSMVLPEIEGTLKTLCEGKVDHIVLFGIEVSKYLLDGDDDEDVDCDDNDDSNRRDDDDDDKNND